MIDIEKYISELTGFLNTKFCERLLYVGLQGSYLRGEANENSDIDIMVVIDELSTDDLAQYRNIIASMDHFDISCGFICSKTDLSNWNPLEISNLLNSTKDYYGVLSELVPQYTKQDIRNFIKISVNNLYHAICHNYIHAERSKAEDALPVHYKSTFFILQNLYYLSSGKFIKTKNELQFLLAGKDKAVLTRSMELCKDIPCDYPKDFDLLFTWCQEKIRTI